MPPKYADGTKVRISTKTEKGHVVYRDLERYENLTGMILSSKAVIAYMMQPMITKGLFHNDSLVITLYMYTVELEEGSTLHDLTEYYLEEIRSTGAVSDPSA